MPVVGFHQARRPRQTPADRLRRELSWPRPGGIAISLVGAALVFSGALALSPTEAVDASTPGGSASVTSTTPPPTLAPTTPAAVPLDGTAEQDSSTSGTLSASGLPASPLGGKPEAVQPRATASPAAEQPPVTGAAASAPIQELFSDDDVSPTQAELRDMANSNSPLVLVNKQRPLVPANYAPSDLISPQVLSGSAAPVLLRAEAAQATERLFSAAASDGIHITATSSYRSYATQVSVYGGYVAQKGVVAADSTSARPGFSEHQTGLALDIGDADAGDACDFSTCFQDSAAAKWVAAHGAEYGFLVRYAAGEEAVTGYLHEPWHLRYVGAAVAQDMKARGIRSFEDYVGLPPAPNYK